jgi:hypothetical protein
MKSFEKCRSCIAKKSDPCKFIGFRAFKINKINNTLKYGPYFTDYFENDKQAFIPDRISAYIMQKSWSGVLALFDGIHDGSDKENRDPSFHSFYMNEFPHLSQVTRLHSFKKQNYCQECNDLIFVVGLMCTTCGQFYCPVCFFRISKTKCTYQRLHTEELFIVIKGVTQDDVYDVH